MFHSNPKTPAPKRTWAVQILTRDYLVTGRLQPQYDDVDDFYNDLRNSLKQGPTHSGYTLPLLQARVRPASNLAAPARSFANWTMRLGPEVIAFIPDDDDSRNTLHKLFDNFTHPFPAMCFGGPYQVQGTLLADTLQGWSNLAIFFPVVEAQIDCLLPGAQLTGWRVPWLLLNGQALQGDGRQPG